MRRKVCEYLGITIDYRQIGKVKFSMEEYINKLLEEAPRHGLYSQDASSNPFF